MMRLWKCFALISLVIGIAYIYLTPATVDLEVFRKSDDFWGLSEDNESMIDETIRKFEITFATHKIDELTRKLGEGYEFTPALEGSEKFEYGMDPENLTNIIKYWRDDYLPRWKEREDFFNQLPHYKTRVQG